MNDDIEKAWMQTYTGRQFFPLRPDAGNIDIEDIAHALSQICRFTGHCREFYSVAQHSVMVSRQLPQPLKLWGLLHDASEAYLCDLAKPIKDVMPAYQEHEERLMRAVACRFSLPWPMPAAIHAADMSLLMTERRDLLCASPAPWGIQAEPLKDVFIVAWQPREAERIFLNTFRTIIGL